MSKCLSSKYLNTSHFRSSAMPFTLMVQIDIATRGTKSTVCIMNVKK